MRCRLLLAAAAAALLAAGLSVTRSATADAEAPPWKVGLASAKITPEGPIRMAGYASRKKPSEGVLADLFAKAMAIEDAQGHRAVLVTCDVIGFRDQVAKGVCDAIEKKTGIKRHQVLLCPSHTHTGPSVGLTRDPDSKVPDDEQRVVHEYTQKLIAELADLAAAALADLKPARLSYGLGAVSFVMNRREFTHRGVRLGFNPRGYVDRGVPVLRVDDPQGKPRAVVFGCACHNTTLTGQHFVLSGDYAGFAQAHVEEKMPGAQAMFIIGCGGDANPYPRGQVEHAKEHGSELGGEVVRVAGGKLKAIGGPLCTVLEAADAPLLPVPSPEKLAEMVKGPHHVSYCAKKMLAAVEAGETLPETYPVPIAVWQFGQDLTLVAISGEVLGGYVPLVEKAVGPLNLWVSGYANDTFGYLPTAAALEEGGYETRGLFVAPGFFTPKAQDVVVARIRELAAKAGRRVP